MNSDLIGRSVKRVEDPRFVTGTGRYTDDVKIPGCLHAVFVRSPYAHARVRGVDKSAALALEGVHAVLGPEDLPQFDAHVPELMEPGSLANPYCDFNRTPPHAVLGREVKFVGQPVAVVVASDAYIAADAAAEVLVDYEELEPIADMMKAFAAPDGAVHEGYRNVVAHLQHAFGAVDEAFARAEVVVEDRLVMQSLKSMSIECRAVVSQFDANTGEIQMWSTTQLPYSVRRAVADVLDMEPSAVRVISRDVGGGFGHKAPCYAEDLVVPVLAWHLRKPVRWAETRSEYMLACNQSGEQIHEVRLAAGADGTIRGIDIKVYKDVGAFNHFEMVCPTNTINHLLIHYKVPALRAEAWSISTHKTPSSPYRGAGRLEATFTMDRMIDLLAGRLGLSPLEVRRRNLIQPDEMPYESGLIYRDGVPVRYDVGDYPAMLEAAVRMSDYDGFEQRRAQAAQAGKLRGMAISSYVEAGGIGPCEGATVSISEKGLVHVSIGVNSQGQSHETTFAQVCAATLEVPFEMVKVSGGDTSLIREGFGTGASRVGVNTSNAVHLACLSLIDKLRKLGAALFHCAADEVSVSGGCIAAGAGRDRKEVSFVELAHLSGRSALMKDLGGPNLTATEYFYPRTVTWSGGFHIAEVELDPETADVQIVKYSITHDCGTPLNAMVVDGQIHGGFAQGLGAALGEEMVYDENGQVLSGSLMDYYMPRAEDVPNLDIEHFVFPTVENPLGVRAIGESGPISPPAVLPAAIENAIGGDCRISRIPVRRSDIVEMLARRNDNKARNGQAN
ncbi:xanthine dehydrogenase family protein molybdopterin-binding subunit [Ramlibacter tataouinensis]|uniref:xanthine dehydrogenase family protein molybdopterin-binding subunit n=1 Tax=Ramlibacter tataouinensis TaxID=94132 RepID=UPI0022F3CB01|nr:xanthine dehydrogenase family protein molybdopterin-binding subunit [Ramlibacter tataouinensis]WBY03012.1 xanthine dehydrogenase family protein molybdopterin-binding subunit [Ramlibacter tataouinensis]